MKNAARITLFFVLIFSVSAIHGVWAQENPPSLNEEAKQSLFGNLSPEEFERAVKYYAEHAQELDSAQIYKSYVRSIIDELFIGKKPDEKEFLYGEIKGFVKSLGDMYSSFLTPSEAKIYREDGEGAFAGIGIQMVNERDHVLVVEVFAGGPADQAGIKKEYKIYAIDGIGVGELSEHERSVKIRGPVGSVVKLSVLKPGSTKLETIEIKRGVVKVAEKQVSWDVKSDVVVIRLPVFSQNTTNDFAMVAHQISQEYPGLPIILDLRGNPGGSVNACSFISSIWLGAGTIFMRSKEKEGETNFFVAPYSFVARDAEGRETEKFPLEPLFAGRKTVVLVDRFTASAAEILAGALEDYGTAIIMGEKTFGKGVAQGLINISDGSLFILTMSRWFTPNGRDIHEKGLEPYVKIPRGDDPEKDTQLERAIDIIKTWK